MRTAHQARQAAVDLLSQSESAACPLTLLDDRTTEYPEGWIFRYDSVLFLATKDIQHAIAGNAPIFVPRVETPPAVISYHRSIQESLEAYRITGNANAREVAGVTLQPSPQSFDLGLAIKAIRRHTTLGMGNAKEALAQYSTGKSTQLSTSTIEGAHTLVSELRQLGVTARVAYDA